MGESRFDKAVQAAWGTFESQLGELLERLEDGSMVIEVEAAKAGPGATPYVQFADDEHPNWWVDVDRDQLDVLRTMAVGALRQALGVPHPRFLAWGPDLEVMDPDDEEPFAFEIGYPTSREELSEMVDATIVRHLESGELQKDEDGDIPIQCGPVPVWVRVLEASPTVRIFSHVVVGAVSTRQARIEADILNRQHGHLKFTVEGRTIIATIDLPSDPFVAQHLRDMVELAGDALGGLAEDLALRTNGRLFFDQRGARRSSR